jgi:hypothetical protein
VASKATWWILVNGRPCEITGCSRRSSASMKMRATANSRSGVPLVTQGCYLPTAMNEGFLLRLWRALANWWSFQMGTVEGWLDRTAETPEDRFHPRGRRAYQEGVSVDRVRQPERQSTYANASVTPPFSIPNARPSPDAKQVSVRDFCQKQNAVLDPLFDRNKLVYAKPTGGSVGSLIEDVK